MGTLVRRPLKAIPVLSKFKRTIIIRDNNLIKMFKLYGRLFRVNW